LCGLAGPHPDSTDSRGRSTSQPERMLTVCDRLPLQHIFSSLSAPPPPRARAPWRCEVDFELDVPDRRDRPGRPRDPGADPVRADRPTLSDPPLGRFRGSEITGDHNQGYLRPSSDRFPTPTDPSDPLGTDRPTDPVWRPRGTSSSKSTSLRPASCAACPRENRVSKALLSHEFCVPSFCSTCRSWSPAPPSRAGPMAPCCLRAQHGLC